MSALAARVRLRRVRRPDAVEATVLAIVLVALAMRVVDLGARAMHHDESLHALYTFRLAEGLGYRHDPLMHGPLQFHVLAAFFKLFGDGEVMARLPAALTGTALVALPLLLRRWLGGAGVVTAALLLAVSPSLLYFSRFARNDLFIAVFTLLMVTAVWRYRQEGGMRWLVLLAAALTLSFATKETTYLTAAVLLLYLDVVLAALLLRRRGVRGRRRAAEAVALAATAWLIAVAWRPASRRLRLGERPREADLLVVLGTLTLPYLAAAVQFPLTAAGVELDGGAERAIGIATVLALVIAAAVVGLSWDWRRWLPLAAFSYAVTLPLFSAGFTDIDGLGGAYWTQLDYWLDQQDVRRGTQPVFYYLMMVPLYEFLALLPALAGGVWLFARGDRLARLLAWWFAGTLIALSLAGEKMPWLTVHLALPLALLAAHVAGAALPAAVTALRRAPGWRWVGAGVAAAAALLLFGWSLRSTVAVTYLHPDTPVEPLIYTQTSPDVPELMRVIEALAEQRGGRSELPVLVDTTASLSWPWAWYLRDYPQAVYASDDTLLDGDVPADGVVIVAGSTLARRPQLRDGYARSLPYRHRWWFPEDGYRAATPGNLLAGLRDASLLVDWFDFYSGRVDAETLGALEAEVLLP